MGSPTYPARDQVAEMMAQSQLRWVEQPVMLDGETASLTVEVEPQSVAAIELRR